MLFLRGFRMNQARTAVLFSLSLGLSLFTSACTTSKAITADEPRTMPAPEPAPAPDPTKVQTATPENPPAPLPSKPLALGAACGSDSPHCGTKGRIAVLVQMNDGRPKKRDVPCTMQSLQREQFGDQGAGCVNEDRLYLTSSCVECRLSSTWEMTGVVAEMSDAQLLAAQKRVGLAAEPILRSPASWRTTIAKVAADAEAKRKR
jgi:hypothetical protein